MSPVETFLFLITLLALAVRLFAHYLRRHF